MHDHIICERASVHFKLICSCTRTRISKRSIVFFSTLCSIWTLLEHLNIKSLHMHVQFLHVHTKGVPAPVAQSVECPLRETWGHGFDPGPWHTKVFQNGTSCSSLTAQYLCDTARTGRGSIRIMWLGVVSCQVSGHDTSVTQHNKSEHWASCRNQTPSWYDWKTVASNVKPEQTTTQGMCSFYWSFSSYKPDAEIWSTCFVQLSASGSWNSAFESLLRHIYHLTKTHLHCIRCTR